MSTSRTEFVRVRGLRLRIRREGDGPPLLLINGLGAAIEMWTPLIRRLSGEFSVTAFDLPGCGMSETACRVLLMRELAGITADVIQAAGHRRAHVLGYSLGGFVAQELAHRHPERVDRLVLAATTAGYPSLPPDPIAAWLMLSPARYLNAGVARAIVPIIAGGRTRHDPGARDAQIRWRVSHPPTVVGYVHQMQAATWFSSHLWLSRLTHPTLVIAGDRDPLIRVSNTRYLARRLPNSELHILPGGGHLMLLDQSREAAPLIRRFLAGD